MTTGVSALSARQQMRIKQDSDDKDAAVALRWLESRGVSFIEFTNGGGLDVGNTPGGLRYAIHLARKDASTC